MHAPCCPDATYREAIDLASDESGGFIMLSLTLPNISEAASADMLALLTCWWLRWIGTVDCAFFRTAEAWELHCRIDKTNRAVLTQVMRDILTIKNAGFL